MRLKPKEVTIIKQAVKECFGNNAVIYLFGSRTEDNKKGGDIDLYVETNIRDHLFAKKLKMLKLLHEKLGDQKIDLVINDFTHSLYIYEVARKEGILL
jgi:predicted nucleotidyltransferase